MSTVNLTQLEPGWTYNAIWKDPFTTAYINALLTTDFNERYTIADIEVGTLSDIVVDCGKFRGENLAFIVSSPCTAPAALEKAGDNFWRVRSGAMRMFSAKLWSPEIRQCLTLQAQQFPFLRAWRSGDDGLIYCREVAWR